MQPLPIFLLSLSILFLFLFFPSKSPPSPSFSREISFNPSVSPNPLSVFSLHNQHLRPSHCQYRGLLQSFPELVGTMNSTVRELHFTTECFGDMNMTLVFLTPETLKVRLVTGEAYDYLCFETLLLVVFGRVYPDIVFMSGEHTYLFRPLTPKQLGELDVFGVKVYLVCGTVPDMLYNGFYLAHLFAGVVNQEERRPSVAAEDTVVELLSTYMNYTLLRRPQVLPALNLTSIHSGDLLGVMEVAGPGAFIMYISGSRLSHIAMALWISQELYVVESFIFGITRTPYHTWIKYANRYNFCVVLLPLKPEIRVKFNSTAALNYFTSMQGTPYGWHNFLYGWLDTPHANLAPPVDTEQILLTAYIIEQANYSQSQVLLSDGLNKRLNTTGLDIMGAVKTAERRGKSIYEVMAESERDEWSYDGRKSLVCSAFAVMMFKNAGIEGFFPLQATEMTPRDLYSIDIFDKHPDYVSVCQVNDPDLPYCQITGKYRLDLGEEYGKDRLGQHSYQTCASKPPRYERDPNC